MTSTVETRRLVKARVQTKSNRIAVVFAVAMALSVTPCVAQTEITISMDAPPATPRILGPTLIGAKPGSPFIYAISATGQTPMTFAATDMPAGLAIDARKGTISGTRASRVAQQGNTEVWARDLSGGRVAVAFFNRGIADATVSIDFSQLDLTDTPGVRDLWQRADVTGMTTGISVNVPHEGAIIYSLTPPGATGGAGGGAGTSGTDGTGGADGGAAGAEIDGGISGDGDGGLTGAGGSGSDGANSASGGTTILTGGEPASSAGGGANVNNGGVTAFGTGGVDATSSTGSEDNSERTTTENSDCSCRFGPRNSRSYWRILALVGLILAIKTRQRKTDSLEKRRTNRDVLRK